MKGILKKILKENIKEYYNSGKSKELTRRPYLYKWIVRMLLCGSLWLGVDHYKCSCGKHQIFIAVPCKTKICPRCGWAYRLKQREITSVKALRCKYFFVTFTTPHNLNFIFAENRKKYLTAMNQAITATFKAYLKERNLKVSIGIVAVPHTFNRLLQFHIHFHILVSCGGIDIDTKKWVAINHYPIKFLKDTFKAKFCAKLRSLHREGHLQFSDKKYSNYGEYNKVIQQAYEQYLSWHTNIQLKDKKTKWVVSDGDTLDQIDYALRYLHRMTISEKNILYYNGKFVTWLPKKNKYESSWSWRNLGKQTTPVWDFIELLLQHIPEKNERAIYYSGLYAPSQKTLYKKAKKIFNKRCSVPALQQADSPNIFNWAQMRKWHTPGEKVIDPSVCPYCGNKIKFITRLRFSEEKCKTHTVKNNQIVEIENTS